MSEYLLTPIEYLKGIGPSRGKVLRSELGIDNFGGLLYYFPFRYIDRSRFHRISDIPELDSAVQIKGVVSGIKEIGKGRGRRLEASFKDDSGTISLVWFKSLFFRRTLRMDESCST